MNNTVKIVLLLLSAISATIQKLIHATTTENVSAFNHELELKPGLAMEYFVLDDSSDEEALIHHICRKTLRNPEQFLKRLFEIGADLNVKSLKFLNTPLMLACRFNNLKAVKILLENGADLSPHNRNRRNALMIALINSNSDVVEILLDHYSRLMEASALELSISSNMNNDVMDQNLMSHAIKSHIPLDKKQKVISTLNLFWDNRDKRGYTALHVAAYSGKMDVFQWVLQRTKPAKIINVRNSSGETALNFAISKKSLEIVALLLQHGSDPNTKNRFFESPLQQCIATFCPIEMIKQLLIHGAKIEISHLYDHVSLSSFARIIGRFEVAVLLDELETKDFAFDQLRQLIGDDMSKEIRKTFIQSL